MAIEEKEQKETILDELIEKVEKDPLPTNIFTTEDTDPLVLLGKLNEVIAHLKALRVLIGESDSKATEALTKAIESLITAQQAITTATTLGNEAKADAQNALEQASSAHDTAGEALMEATDALTKAEQAITTATTLGNDALTKAEQAITTATTLGNEAKAEAQQAINTANEALSQVVQGLGTKVYDNQGNLLAGAKFTGHNGINVDMDETDPETFNIRLDNEVIGQLEEMQSNIITNTNQINQRIPFTILSTAFDANSFRETKLYSVATSDGANMPSLNWGFLLVNKQTPNNVVQLFIADANRIFTRKYRSGTWAEWSEYATKTDFNNASNRLTTIEKNYVKNINVAPFQLQFTRNDNGVERKVVVQFSQGVTAKASKNAGNNGDTDWLFVSVDFPVGFVLLTTNKDFNPAHAYGGTWEQLPTGKALWSGTKNQAGGTIEAGLPNLSGTLGTIINRNGEAQYSGFQTYSGVFTSNTRNQHRGYFNSTASGDAGASIVNFNASASNNIYGKSTTVQPPAICVIAWKKLS